LLQLLRCFDPFGDYPHAEVSSQIGDGADDGARFFFVWQAGNKTAVDFDFAEWKTQQIAKRTRRISAKRAPTSANSEYCARSRNIG
jgi:hypothetical protein